jgi:hypothetical protein
MPSKTLLHDDFPLIQNIIHHACKSAPGRLYFLTTTGVLAEQILYQERLLPPSPSANITLFMHNTNFTDVSKEGKGCWVVVTKPSHSPKLCIVKYNDYNTVTLFQWSGVFIQDPTNPNNNIPAYTDTKSNFISHFPFEIQLQ